MTSCIATVSLIDTTAHEDATIDTMFNNTVGDLNLFDTDSGYAEKVNTTELNRTVLDGTFNTPSEFKVPFWSIEKSEDDCTFLSTPSLIVKFSKAHTSVGITLKFLEDYPSKILVSWYSDQDGNVKIDSKYFYPNSTEYVCFKQIENYKSVKIEFIKTRQPQQYIRMTFMLYGEIRTWADEDVMKATVTEEVDSTSSTLPINTAELTLVDENDDFNIQNTEGLWKSLQAEQKILLTENVNGTILDVGTYYIDTWESKDNSITLNLVDALGLIDKTKFMGGMYTDVSVGDLIDSIMASANVTDYEVSEDLKSLSLSGYIPIMSHREALQQIAFAIGAVVDSTRGSTIRIHTPDKNIDSYILLDRKFSGKCSIALDEYVSGVSITCTKYSALSEASEIYNGYLSAGTHRIEFTEPYTSLTCEGGTIESSGVNYAIVTSAGGDVALNGIGYESSEYTVTKNVNVIEVGQIENIKSFSGLTIYNPSKLLDVAEQLLNWYALRQKVSLEYICEKEKVGEWVGIQDSLNQNSYSITRINSQTIDLCGGYLASAECRGYATIVSSYYYMGDELPMGTEGII